MGQTSMVGGVMTGMLTMGGLMTGGAMMGIAHSGGAIVGGVTTTIG
jgi:hypothetical protein